MRPSAGFDVATVVASAGGLGAISIVLGALPHDIPVAVVVGQHLSAEGSTLVEILAGRVALPVEWAVDGAKVLPGTVTVCPPRSLTELLPDGTLSVGVAQPERIHHPLDRLIASAAESYGRRALAVVLTGMGGDGTGGAIALRRAGGIVIAQSEDSAEHPSMPRAVVEAGAADLVLTVNAIGPTLVELASGRPVPEGSRDRTS